MIQIREAVPADYQTICDIAYETWPGTYGPILSKNQLEYMLAAFYSVESIAKNVDVGNQHFLLASENGKVLAFIAYEHFYKQKPITRIHKIYLLPESQGKGIGKLLIDWVADLALEVHSEKLSLNVNRYNKALHFYQKLGFEIVGEEDIVLEHGYLMEDFMMEKKLNL